MSPLPPSPPEPLPKSPILSPDVESSTEAADVESSTERLSRNASSSNETSLLTSEKEADSPGIPNIDFSRFMASRDGA